VFNSICGEGDGDVIAICGEGNGDVIKNKLDTRRSLQHLYPKALQTMQIPGDTSFNFRAIVLVSGSSMKMAQWGQDMI